MQMCKLLKNNNKNNKINKIYMKKQQLINITDQEWEKAYEILKQKIKNKDPDPKIYGKDIGNKNLSFIYINNELYCSQNSEYLGIGGFGKVKIAQDRNGYCYAMKIEQKFESDAAKAQKETELKIMQELGYLHGSVTREKPKEKMDKRLSRNIKNKNYLLQSLHEGESLDLYTNYIPSTTYNDDDSQLEEKLIVALKAAESIKSLHEKNIIHCDIKPENFMAKINGIDPIIVSAIDFGFSMKLEKDQTFIDRPETFGTPGYMAPEIGNSKTNKYSKASDMFAFGRMLIRNVKLKGEENSELRKLLGRSINSVPKERPTINELITGLKNTLQEKYPDTYNQMYNTRELLSKKLDELGKVNVKSQYKKINTSNNIFKNIIKKLLFLRNPKRAKQLKELQQLIKNTIEQLNDTELTKEKALDAAMSFNTKLESICNDIGKTFLPSRLKQLIYNLQEKILDIEQISKHLETKNHDISKNQEMIFRNNVDENHTEQKINKPKSDKEYNEYLDKNNTPSPPNKPKHKNLG